MTTEEQVVFRLNALCRFDEEVKSFVGYIPRLQVYAQARNQEDIPKALRATALQFILACANKGILASVMREGGSHPTTRNIADAIADKDAEFVAVLGYKECAEAIEITIPLSLMTEQLVAEVA